MVVSLEAESAIAREEIFQVEIANESRVGSTLIAITEITIEEESIVEEA